MISVIIPAYNAARTIDVCLAALQNQTLAAAEYEVIVVDDGSTDDTAARAQKTNVTLLRQPHNKGAAAARNLGLTAATGDIICFTDADCVPRPDWLAELTRPLQDPSISGGKGIYETNQQQLVARFVQIEYEDKYDLMHGQETIDFVDTYSAVYRHSALDAVGGFDERIFYVEDQELSFRLVAQGYKMVFCPTAVVSHTHSDTIRKYARKKYMIGYHKAQFIRRYPNRVIRDSHTPQSLKVQMGLAALILLSLAGTILLTTLALVTAVLLFIFLLTTLPFGRKAWGKDRAVALASPFLLFVRAVSLGFGFGQSIISVS
ncbi:MAG: glycosyltransferase [Chloroflexi bacterium]|nr:glycosyltransferase [Chloroflexota bacterium]